MQTVEDVRLRDFQRAVERLRREAESELGASDAAHLESIRTLSRRLELLGRALLHFSFEPLGFGAGVVSLWAHKCIELMELGHAASAAGEDPQKVAALWGASFQSLDWAGLIGSTRSQVRETVRVFRLQTDSPSKARAARSERTASHHRAHDKALGYLARVVLLVPPLTRPFFWKVALGTLLAEVARDGLWIAMTRAGRVDAARGCPTHDPSQPYVSQMASARDIELPLAMSILCGALDKRVEHHLFPHLPPQRLRQLAPRVRALCAAHGVPHRSVSMLEAMRSLFARNSAI